MTKKSSYRKIVHLSFPQEKSSEGVVCNLALEYGLTFNILKAQILPRQVGSMTLEIRGDKKSFEKGLDYLKGEGLNITDVSQKIERDEDSCVNCGMCTAICPTKALSLDLETRLVSFDKDACSACGMCVKVCPVHAMHVDLENGELH